MSRHKRRWCRLCSSCRAHRMSAEPRDRIYTISRDTTVSSRTDRLVKVAVPGPLTLTSAIRIRDAYSGRDDLAEDLVAVVNAELRALVAAGCRFVQVDEPS